MCCSEVLGRVFRFGHCLPLGLGKHKRSPAPDELQPSRLACVYVAGNWMLFRVALKKVVLNFKCGGIH